MTTGSIFWVVLLAISGGAFVLVGLLMERFSEKTQYENLSDFRRCKSRKVCGEWWVIAGIVVEIGVGIFSAVDAWRNDPLNRPIRTISATAFLTIKMENKILDPASDDNWRSGISFLLGTNETDSGQLFNLSANKKNVEFGQILGIKNCTNCGLFTIQLHQNPPYPGFPAEKGLGMPLKTFDDVGCLVFSMPQVSSNAEVVSGSVIVTVNSSLTWNFEIPPQKQRWGFITAKKIKIAKNEFKTEVLPIKIVDNAYAPTFTNFFDGK